MALLKGKGRLNTTLEYSIDITRDRTIIIDLLKTLELFSINIYEDVEEEINRLKTLTTDYPELGDNE
jgi:hypothetical protein